MSRMKLCLATALLVASVGALADEVPDEGTTRVPAPAAVAPPPPPVEPAPRPAPAPMTRRETPPAYVAQAEPRRPFYIAPMALYSRPGCDDCADGGPGGALAIGKEVSEYLDAELIVEDRKLDLNNEPGSVRVDSVGMNLLIIPSRHKAFSPFIQVGLGAQRHGKVAAQGENIDPYIAAGVGFLASPWSWDGAIRGGLHWQRAANDICCFANGEGIATLGLQIPL